MNKFFCFVCLFLINVNSHAELLKSCDQLTPSIQTQWVEQGKIQELIACGIDVNTIYELQANGEVNRFTALQIMAIAGNLDAVKILLVNHANPNLIPDRENGGVSPLNHAIFFKNFNVALELIHAGANTKEVSYLGKDTLLMILGFSDLSLPKVQKIFQFLIKDGPNINAQNVHGSTALHVAVGNKNTIYAKKLLEMGADACIKNKQGKTAVDMAKEKGIELFDQFTGPCLLKKAA